MGKAAEGKKAPQFSLVASTGGSISLKDYLGKSNVALYGCPEPKGERHADEVLRFVRSLG
jgi:peroxiredoxin